MRSCFATVLCLALSGCAGEPGWIDDRFYVRTDDGTDLYVHAVGDGTSNEFVVFLHGGPGGGSSTYELAPSARILHEDLVMVYLDQRGQGASEGRTRPEDLTLPTLAQDVVEVMDVVEKLYLDDRIGDPRLWLMGHSWGGLLGPQVLLETVAADRLAGWIEVAGAHDVPKMYTDSRTLLIETAELQLEGKLDDESKASWQELRKSAQAAPAASPDLAQLLELQQLAQSTTGLLQEVEDQHLSNGEKIGWALNRPNDALANILAANAVSKALLDKELKRSWSERYRELTLPTLLVWGRYDLVVPTTLAEDVQLRIASQTADLVILENSAHAPMFQQPEAYAEAILDFMAEVP